MTGSCTTVESQVIMEHMKVLLNVLRTGTIFSSTEVQKHVNLVETHQLSTRADLGLYVNFPEKVAVIWPVGGGFK